MIKKEKISIRPRIIKKLQYIFVHTGSAEKSATPYKSAVEPTLERQPAAMPIACSGVSPETEMTSIETKKTTIKRKKKLST